MGEGKRPDILHRFHGFAFGGNLLSFRSLYPSVKAVKAKNKTFSIDARVRARGKGSEGGRFISEVNATPSEVEKTTSEVDRCSP